MVYNKLVRDNIPIIIEKRGQLASFRILEDEEYSYCLRQKLNEEVAEFQQDRNLEELADILEVVYALSEDLGYSKEDLMEAYRKKHEERGGFSKRILLVSNEG